MCFCSHITKKFRKPSTRIWQDIPGVNEGKFEETFSSSVRLILLFAVLSKWLNDRPIICLNLQKKFEF